MQLPKDKIAGLRITWDESYKISLQAKAYNLLKFNTGL